MVSSKKPDKAAEQLSPSADQSIVLQEVFGSDLGSDGEDMQTKLMDLPSPAAEPHSAKSPPERKRRSHASHDTRDRRDRRKGSGGSHSRSRSSERRGERSASDKRTRRVVSEDESESDGEVDKNRRSPDRYDDEDLHDTHSLDRKSLPRSDDDDDYYHRRAKSSGKKRLPSKSDDENGEESSNHEDDDENEIKPVKKKRKVLRDDDDVSDDDKTSKMSKFRKAPVFDDEDLDDEEEVNVKARKAIKSEREQAFFDDDDDGSDGGRGKRRYDSDRSEDSEEGRRRERKRRKAEKAKNKSRERKKIKLERREDYEDMDDRAPRKDDYGSDGDGANDGYGNRAEFEEEEEEVQKPKKPLNAFEKAIEENKAMRRSRKQDLDPAQVEAECVAFLEKMMRARDEDIRSYKRGKPALEKLKMLREVELMLMKVSHREQLLDNVLLAIIKAWLDPMPDGALPNVQIRTSLLNILSSFRVDSDWVERLESSQGLGRVVHFLSRNDDHAPNRRLAEKLMMKWARPVYQSNSNFHDLLEEFDKPDEGRRAPKDGVASERRAAMETVKHFKTAQERMQQFKKKDTNDTRSQQILATVPRRTPFLFTALAESSASVDEKQLREMRSTKARNKKVNRTMSTLRRANKNRSARAAKPSLNGR